MSTSGLFNEQPENQKDILKALEDPDAIAKFVEDCKKTGQNAVAIDTSLKRVHDSFVEIIKNYGKDFPELKDYSARWDGFRVVSERLFFFLFHDIVEYPCVLALGWVRWVALEVKGPCVLHSNRTRS